MPERPLAPPPFGVPQLPNQPALKLQYWQPAQPLGQHRAAAVRRYPSEELELNRRPQMKASAPDSLEALLLKKLPPNKKQEIPTKELIRVYEAIGQICKPRA